MNQLTTKIGDVRSKISRAKNLCLGCKTLGGALACMIYWSLSMIPSSYYDSMIPMIP